MWICIFDCFTKDPGCTIENAQWSRGRVGVYLSVGHAQGVSGGRVFLACAYGMADCCGFLACAYFVADCCVCGSVFKEPGCTKFADNSTTPMACGGESQGVYLPVDHTQGVSQGRVHRSGARFCVQHLCAGGVFMLCLLRGRGELTTGVNGRLSYFYISHTHGRAVVQIQEQRLNLSRS